MINIVKNFLTNKKYLLISGIIVIIVTILFNIFYRNNLFNSTKEDTAGTPNNNGSSSVLVPSLSEGQSDIIVQNIKGIRSNLIKKSYKNKIKFNFDVTEAETGLINSRILPTAYSITPSTIDEIKNAIRAKSASEITKDVFRFEVNNKDLFINFYSNLLSVIEKDQVLGKFSIEEDGESNYLIKAGDEFSLAPYRENATYTSKTYLVKVNGLPLITYKGLLLFTVIENIKTKEAIVDTINFFPKSTSVLATFKLTPGEYIFSPLVSEDSDFVGYVANNDTNMYDGSFKINDSSLNVDYFLDTTNNYLIPLVTKKAYLVTSDFSMLKSKGYLLVANDR